MPYIFNFATNIRVFWIPAIPTGMTRYLSAVRHRLSGRDCRKPVSMEGIGTIKPDMAQNSIPNLSKKDGGSGRNQ